MAAHPRTLAWRIPWTENPGRHYWATNTFEVSRRCEFWGESIQPTAAAAAKSLQSCPTLCDPIDGSPPDSPIPGILQARTLEWVAISFSNAWKWKMKMKSLSSARLLATHGLQPTRLFRPWDLPGKSTGVRCHCLLLQPTLYTLTAFCVVKCLHAN